MSLKDKITADARSMAEMPESVRLKYVEFLSLSEREREVFVRELLKVYYNRTEHAKNAFNEMVDAKDKVIENLKRQIK